MNLKAPKQCTIWILLCRELWVAVIAELGAVPHRSVSREEMHRSLTDSPPHSLPSVLAMPHAWDVSLLSDSYLALKAEAMIKLKLRGTSLNKHIQNFPSYNLPV